MARPSSPNPTQLELEILKVIWRDGPASVRQVRDALANAGRPLAYTSVMTIMNIMTRKKYLRRTKAGASAATGAFTYAARVREKPTLGRMLRDLVDRVFNGSTAAVMQNLLATTDLDPAELAKLRAMVDEKARQDGRPPQSEK
jgi:BlaI family transcriptional regulator, penicillinase repressor